MAKKLAPTDMLLLPVVKGVQDRFKNLSNALLMAVTNFIAQEDAVKAITTVDNSLN